MARASSNSTFSPKRTSIAIRCLFVRYDPFNRAWSSCTVVGYSASFSVKICMITVFVISSRFLLSATTSGLCFLMIFSASFSSSSSSGNSSSFASSMRRPSSLGAPESRSIMKGSPSSSASISTPCSAISKVFARSVAVIAYQIDKIRRRQTCRSSQGFCHNATRYLNFVISIVLRSHISIAP